MEVTVLAFETLLRRMGVIIVLGMALRVVDIALGVVVPLVEGAVVAQQLADHVVAGLLQQPMDIEHFVGGFAHGLQARRRKVGELEALGRQAFGDDGSIAHSVAA